MNKNNKQLKVNVHVKINGEYYPWESLSAEQQKEIGIALNDRALRSIGYTPIQK